MSMQSLSSILKNKSTASPLIKGVTAALAVEASNEELSKLFGPAIAEHASAAYVKNGILTIACLSSTVAQELKLHEVELIQAINKKLDFTLVYRIKYLS